MTREQIELLCKNIQACTGDWKPEESILLKHDAEQRLVIEQQAQQIARLENGLGCSRSHPHEDMNQICELRTEVARLKNELSQRTNLEGSAPCWNSAHMKQIATLREALQAIYDIKNGCPLPRYQKDWDRAMERVEQLLKEHP